MAFSVNVMINAGLRNAGVRMFRKMGADTAQRLVRELHVQCRTPELIESLSQKGYFKAKDHLKEQLPQYVIGFKFDKKECELLDSMGTGSRYWLFRKTFGTDRAYSMWHEYFKHNPFNAVEFLTWNMDNKPYGLPVKVIVGNSTLKEKDVPLIRDILSTEDKVCISAYDRRMSNNSHDPFNYVGGEPRYIATALMGLNDQFVLKAVVQLEFSVLKGAFVEELGHQESSESLRRGLNNLSAVLRALGRERTIAFYKYLLNKSAANKIEGDLAIKSDGEVYVAVMDAIADSAADDRNKEQKFIDETMESASDHF